MTPKMRWAAGAGALALVALLGWAFAPQPLAVETAAVALAPYEQSIAEDGRTRLRDRYLVTAPLAGRLARTALREGDPVAAGAVVASLTPVLSPLLDERSQREQAARVDGAQAAVQRAAAVVTRAQVGLAQARDALQRSAQLAGQGFVAPAKLETDRLALEAAQRELDTAVQGRHVAEHDRDTAEAALLAVHATAAGGHGTVQAFALRSPVAGRVIRIAQANETTVALGAPLLEIGDTARLEIVAELLTSDALQSPVGAEVHVERWGGPGALAGRVRRVEPGAFTKVSALGVEEQRVNVLVDLTSPPADWQALGDGYRVGVRIVTLSRPSVPCVPVSAVFPRAGGGMAVFVVDADGHARLRPVELGGRNGRQAWLRGGVDLGASVIVYPPSTLRDGARVKTRTVPTA